MRRTEITIETRSLTIIKIQNANTETIFCPQCKSRVPPLTPLNAALIFRVGKDLLETLTGSGKLHRLGENALCPASIADHFKQEIRFIED